MLENTQQLLKSVIQAAEQKKAHEIVTLSLEGISLMTDYFVICHGNSEPQVVAIANAIRKIADQMNYQVRIEGMDTARWILIDMGEVVAHIFYREEREYYRLERLWSGAKAVEQK